MSPIFSLDIAIPNVLFLRVRPVNLMTYRSITKNRDKNPESQQF